MSGSDEVTFRDPDVPGMVFGRAPTRPGGRGAEDDRAGGEPPVSTDPSAVTDLPEPGAAEVADPEPGTAAVEPPDDSEAAAATEAQAERAPVAPGAEPALDPDQVADLQHRWAAIQTGFVDDPRGAVEVADAIVAEAVAALQATIDARRAAMSEPWRDDADASTDALLAAFQGYRSVFDRVLSV